MQLSNPEVLVHSLHHFSLLYYVQVDLEASDTSEGKTCLHWAAKSTGPSTAAIVQMLCKKKKPLQNSKDKYGHTPLHSATTVGNVEAMKTLLTMGSDPSITDDDQYTAMHLATGNSSPLLCTCTAKLD